MADLATLLALLRGLHLAATLSLLGVVGFITWVLPAATTGGRDIATQLIGLWRVAGLAALLTIVAWFVLQSAILADAANLNEVIAALPIVAQHTRYGGAMLLRAGLLLVVTLLAGTSGFRLYSALLLIAIVLGLQGLIGHAGALGGRVGAGILASEALHLFAAGVWLGVLVPLWLSIGRLPARAGTAICERFSPIGLACVVVIAGTGLAQGSELIGGIPALIGTHYGRIALLKVVLFLAVLALAALNRLWLTDSLSQAGVGAQARLRLSVAGEALLGFAIILTAACLASSVPAEHEAPVWPLSWRLSLVSLNEDPDLRVEVIVSLLLIGLATLLLAATCLWGRFRIIALVVLVATVALRGASLELLTVEAYPSSFQKSPTGFAAVSIVRGQVLFGQSCAACHGPQGDGNGPLAGGLRTKPADLTMPHLWEHSDGDLFWWLSHGVDDPEGGLAMPGFPGLSDADRWALIDYIRAHNAGLAMQRDANLVIPVAAPVLPIRCIGFDASRTDDLRGHVVHVMADGVEEELSPISPQLGVSVITLELRSNDTEALPAGSCVASTPAAWPAYAVLADVPPDQLSGTEFLIDPNGWLRAVQTSGRLGGWHTRDGLSAAVRGICANPIQRNSGGDYEHHH
jgi:putative copper export protein/mono/diheme cytochrome c family protein